MCSFVFCLVPSGSANNAKSTNTQRKIRARGSNKETEKVIGSNRRVKKDIHINIFSREFVTQIESRKIERISRECIHVKTIAMKSGRLKQNNKRVWHRVHKAYEIRVTCSIKYAPIHSELASAKER